MHFGKKVDKNSMELDFPLIIENFQMLYGFYPTVIIFESDI